LNDTALSLTVLSTNHCLRLYNQTK